MLRLIDPEMGRALPALAQAEAARREAEKAQRLEAEARREAETTLRGAREEVLRLRVALEKVHRKRSQ